SRALVSWAPPETLASPREGTLHTRSFHSGRKPAVEVVENRFDSRPQLVGDLVLALTLAGAPSRLDLACRSRNVAIEGHPHRVAREGNAPSGLHQPGGGRPRLRAFDRAARDVEGDAHRGRVDGHQRRT